MKPLYGQLECMLPLLLQEACIPRHCIAMSCNAWRRCATKHIATSEGLKFGFAPMHAQVACDMQLSYVTSTVLRGFGQECDACLHAVPYPLPLLLADPLRVMRAVRFATRFNFAPDPAILTAAASEEVRYAWGLSL